VLVQNAYSVINADTGTQKIENASKSLVDKAKTRSEQAARVIK